MEEKRSEKGTFEPGHLGGPGRPPGSKDRRWADLQMWGESLLGIFEDQRTTIALKTTIALHVFDTLIARRKLPPETPEESKENAVAAQALLKKMEDNARSGPNAGRA